MPPKCFVFTPTLCKGGAGGGVVSSACGRTRVGNGRSVTDNCMIDIAKKHGLRLSVHSQNDTRTAWYY